MALKRNPGLAVVPFFFSFSFSRRSVIQDGFFPAIQPPLCLSILFASISELFMTRKHPEVCLKSKLKKKTTLKWPARDRAGQERAVGQGALGRC